MKQLIINTEYFLQCHGSCSGCFLTEEERNSSNTYLDQLLPSLKIIAEKYQNEKIEHLIIGFGRGNILNLVEKDLQHLVKAIHWCEENFQYIKLTFEVSTSLIGKVEKQIEIGTYLLQHSKNIFFNIVVNSEITSPTFWKNFTQFYEAMANIRKNWGWIEDWGDIVVLNVNPQKLPNLELIKEIVKEHKSPINISLFPFDTTQKTILNSEIEKLNQWSEQLWSILKEKDFNMKNYLDNLNNIDLPLQPKLLQNYYDKTMESYIFIDKEGIITEGMSSIMGEVDFPRLLAKYEIEPNILNAYKSMQKDIYCSQCEYQKECLVSGAFLNYLANSNKIKNKGICASGYKPIFQLSKEM